MMLIYTFMACRMLSIYYKLRSAEHNDAIKCRVKCARWLAAVQNYIIAIFFLACSSSIWLNYAMYPKAVDDDEDTFFLRKKAFFIVSNSLKLIYEVAVGVIFLLLFIVFNDETVAFQANAVN